MKNRILSIGILLVFGLIGNIKLQAQSGCIANIQKRLDVIGTDDFSIHKAREIIREFDFGNVQEFNTHPGKRLAFKKVFESLSDFFDLAPDSLSGEGLLGLTKFLGVSVRTSDSVLTELNIEHMKEAFTEAGRFKGDSLDPLLRKLGDSGKFDFEPATRTFRSRRSGLAYGDGPKANGSYSQGERHAISHTLRGHVKNDFSIVEGKSLFSNPGEIFDLIDEAWLNPAKISIGGNGWEYDFAPRVIGVANETKIRIRVDGDKLRTAHPVR